MTQTLWKLRRTIEQNAPHSFTPGRCADSVMPDQMAVAMDLMLKKKQNVDDGEDEAVEVEPDDLMED